MWSWLPAIAWTGRALEARTCSSDSYSAAVPSSTRSPVRNTAWDSGASDGSSASRFLNWPAEAPSG